MTPNLRLLLLSAWLVLATAVSPAAESSPIAFRGRVVSITSLRDEAGCALATHVDPRYALTVEVISAQPDAPPFASGRRVVLAIHSPAQLFTAGSDRPIGRIFSFTVMRTTDHGRASYSGLATRN